MKSKVWTQYIKINKRVSKQQEFYVDSNKQTRCRDEWSASRPKRVTSCLDATLALFDVDVGELVDAMAKVEEAVHLRERKHTSYSALITPDIFEDDCDRYECNNAMVAKSFPRVLEMD